MKRIIHAVDHIRLIDCAYVDRSFGQGRDAVMAQLMLRTEVAQAKSLVDQIIEDDRQDLEEVQNWVKPYQLPEEYLFFLKFYGGLLIEKKNYNFMIHGFGPMVEEWYSFLMGDDAYTEPRRDGLLTLGSLESKTRKNEEYQYIIFLLDLSGVVQQNGVLGFRFSSRQNLVMSEVIKNFDTYQPVWKIIANSFPEWLELIANTEGTLGYLL